MSQYARLIIPVWGDRYADTVLSIMLPAVLAPGNLPALSEIFEVELVIVTETRLFDLFHRAPVLSAVGRLCKVRLVPLDDLLTEFATDYGVTLSHALFRGFSDLGARMTEVYLLFLNADFVVCDGCLSYLARLMQEGRRVIHAPSFRVVAESVYPRLLAVVDSASGALRVGCREMVKLALANKHPSVKARTVNQRLCHQSWMDQFYWYVDEDTLIGYQAPVALVAIKPERVVMQPVLVWDFGFLPAAAPAAQRHFITDSDDFFMIEPQSRHTGREMIRVGWTSAEQVARDLSMWLTTDQRDSSKQLLKIHASDLPPYTDEVIGQARLYMADIERRLSRTPVSHLDHPLLSQWFRETKLGNDSPAANMGRADIDASSALPTRVRSAEPRLRSLSKRLVEVLEAIYRKTFGSPPQVGKFHPLWADTAPISDLIQTWRDAGYDKVLWISSSNSLLRRLGYRHVNLGSVITGDLQEAIAGDGSYDACLCELTLLELMQIEQIYSNVRPLVRHGGHILICVSKSLKIFDGARPLLQAVTFPGVDVSQINFWGDLTSWFASMLYRRAARTFRSRPLIRAVAVSTTLLLLAPFVWLSNARSARRDPTIFRPTWTSLTIKFKVR